MTIAITKGNPKTAEFARLFELFDRIATRRARGSTELAISMDDIQSVPAEFAPVLKNLSTVLSLRAQRNQKRLHKPIGRPRRNTVGIAPMTQDTIDEVEDVGSPSFPLEEHHPFTFKLMLHNLYNVDEWAQKVKSAVEVSKEQFKPLAERVQEMTREGAGKERVVGRNINVVRSRSQSVINPKSKGKALSREQVPASPVRANDFGRVLKKRCVGRRKSISGPLAGSVWVYDAAISAVELDGGRPSLEITISKSKDALLNNTGMRSRHQSLAGLEGIQDRDTTRRKVRIAVPLAQDDVQGASALDEETHSRSGQQGNITRYPYRRITPARGLSMIPDAGSSGQHMKRSLNAQ
ncbi:uncharacterized protein HD556DRAFT_518436 [Suillus plorans]|uniref:Uncharacterized protein n=1 Tax=Suillus plorans TaxID=116603 RepID=A0A9P7AQ63_9AGAM|nr:uncharacterized protein HD556DRAFT_518436 [Suillus plorans]KAG1793089.1 hypothetical protein HD556DRAFT_518436 [Suillus plorans]